MSLDQEKELRKQLARAYAEFDKLTDTERPSGNDGLSINYDAKHDQLLNRIAFLNEQLNLQQPPVEHISQGVSP